MKDIKDEFYSFLDDEVLEQANYALMRTNDLLDIFKPKENDHSEILAWLFNPREGHGQGDAIFKDFLSAASKNTTAKHSDSHKFFQKWTPARIANTGFQSLIIEREYSLKDGSRLDLLMIDPINRIIVIVENTRHAKAGPKQLNKYHTILDKHFKHYGFRRGNQNLYSFAYIVLDSKKQDKEYELDDAGQIASATLGEFSDRWAYISYQWLERGARRAEAQQRRGNMSAGLVISYCHRQSGYISPEQDELDNALADLKRRYEKLIPEFKKIKTTKILEASALEPGKFESDLSIFVHSHRELIKNLVSASSLAFVACQIPEELQDDNFMKKVQPTRVRLFNKGWYAQEGPGFENSPVQVVANRMLKRDPDNNPLYRVTVEFRRQYVEDTELAKQIENKLKNEFPKTRGKNKDSKIARYGTLREISADDISQVLVNTYKTTAEAMR